MDGEHLGLQEPHGPLTDASCMSHFSFSLRRREIRIDAFLQLRWRPPSRYRLRRPNISWIRRCVTRSNSLLFTSSVSFVHAARSFGRLQRNAGVPSDEMGDGSANSINTRRRRFLNGVGPRCVLFLLAISCMSSHALPPISSSLPVLSSSGRIRTAWRRSPRSGRTLRDLRRPQQDNSAPHLEQDPVRLGGQPSAAGPRVAWSCPHTCSRTTRLGCSLHSQQV